MEITRTQVADQLPLETSSQRVVDPIELFILRELKPVFFDMDERRLAAQLSMAN